MKKLLTIPVYLCAFLLSFIIIFTNVSAAILPQFSHRNFESQLLDIAQLSKFYNSQTKQFDKSQALQNKFAPESVDIADEMYKANNEVIDKGVANGVKWDNYPKLKDFLTNATTQSKVSATNLATASTSDTSIWYILGRETIVRFVCGYFGNPQPTISQYAYTWRNLSDSATTLRNWGYHETNSLYGNGWTRAQSWSPWACNYNSFRDSAWIIDNHTMKEKNYDGWNPRGEPNPEINTYSWPYAEWPLYVAWWHSYHQ